MYPPNIANVAKISHINVPFGHVFGTTGITVLFCAVSDAVLLLVSFSTNPFSVEIMNSF
jgi:hypothetical protein